MKRIFVVNRSRSSRGRIELILNEIAYTTLLGLRTNLNALHRRQPILYRWVIWVAQKCSPHKIMHHKIEPTEEINTHNSSLGNISSIILRITHLDEIIPLIQNIV